MSPSSLGQPPSEVAAAVARRLFILFGAQVHNKRVRRHWSLRELGRRSHLYAAAIQSIEAGGAASLDAYTRLADALGMRIELEFVDPRRRNTAQGRLVDSVHSAMGEFEAGDFRRIDFPASLDEPYQHNQFAGRPDVVAWDLEARALLHIENRTRFPDFQEMAGSFNAKRAYLGRFWPNGLAPVDGLTKPMSSWRYGQQKCFTRSA